MSSSMVGPVFEQMEASLQNVLSRFGIKHFVDELSRIVCVCDYQIPSYVVCLVSPRYIGNMTYHVITYSGTEHNHEITAWETSKCRFLVVKGQIWWSDSGNAGIRYMAKYCIVWSGDQAFKNKMYINSKHSFHDRSSDFRYLLLPTPNISISMYYSSYTSGLPCFPIRPNLAPEYLRFELRRVYTIRRVVPNGL